MSLSATVTAGKRFTSSELVDNAKLNQMAVPSVILSGSADTSQISADSVTAAKLAFGAAYYCSASTVANVITLIASGHTLSDATIILPTSVGVPGVIAVFKADATNTGTVDIQLGSGTAKNLYKDATQELAAGDIRIGQMVVVEYDGTQWQMVSGLGNSAGSRFAETASTVADQYTAIFAPTVTALVDGLRVLVKWNATNTSTAQFNPDSLGLKAIRKAGDAALVAGDIVDNQISELVYDSSANAAAGAWLLTGPTTPTTRTTVPVRQCILSCSVDGTTALPNFLTGIGSTFVNFQNCASPGEPLVLAFAYGQDANGAVDFVATINANTSNVWTGLSAANTTYYLYADRNISTGAITYGQTTTRPIYTNAIGIGNNTYIITTGKMVNGSSTAIQRLFVGEAATGGAGTLTSVTPYMPRGEFKSGADTAITASAAANQTVTEIHQLGVAPRRFQWVLVCYTIDLNWAVGDELPVQHLLEVGAGSTDMAAWSYANVNSSGLILPWLAAGDEPILVDKTTYAFGGRITPGSWKARCYASRGW